MMNKSAFGKTLENVRKHRDIKLVTPNGRKIHLVSEASYHMRKWFSENLTAKRINKVKIKIEKWAYLGLLILDIIKITMYEY